MSDLGGNPEDRFSQNEAQIIHFIWYVIYPNKPSGLFHPFQMGESIFSFTGISSKFFTFISFFDGIHVNKQNGIICGISTGVIPLCLHVRGGIKKFVH